VTLPVTQAPAPEHPLPIRHIVGYEGARQKVLVVDDKEYNRRLLVDMLQPLGFEVRTAEDGQQAIDATQAWRPNVILMTCDAGQDWPRGDQGDQQQPALEGVFIVAVSASVLEADEERAG